MSARACGPLRTKNRASPIGASIKSRFPLWAAPLRKPRFVGLSVAHPTRVYARYQPPERPSLGECPPTSSAHGHLPRSSGRATHGPASHPVLHARERIFSVITSGADAVTSLTLPAIRQEVPRHRASSVRTSHQAPLRRRACIAARAPQVNNTVQCTPAAALLTTSVLLCIGPKAGGNDAIPQQRGPGKGTS